MTNHPIHMHGYDFKVTGTTAAGPEGAAGPRSRSTWRSGRCAFEFVADVPGDWALHCHKSHHTMNAMGHDVKTYIGRQHEPTAPALKKIAPATCRWAAGAWARWVRWRCSSPDNTLPMMTGYAQFGPVEMGGMFTVVKVRPGLAASDYKDPGWYQHPEGTVAYEWTGPQLAEAPRAKAPDSGVQAAEFRAVDPRKRPVRSATASGHGNH